MGFTEEVVLRLGFNAGPASAGMRGFVGRMGAFKQELSSSLAGAFSFGAALGFFNKVIDHFDDIKDRAENLNVSTDFFQGMARTFATNGSSAEAFAKAMDKLNIKLGQAREGNKQAVADLQRYGLTLAQIAHASTEDVFYQLADSLRATGDNSKIAAGAFDIFGKSGASMVSVLSHGSDTLKQFVKDARKLSEEDVKALSQVKDDLKNGWESALVAGGKLLTMWGKLAAAAGEFSVHGFNGDSWKGARAAEVHARLAAEKKAVQDKVDADIAASKQAEADALKQAAAAETARLDAAERALETYREIQQLEAYTLTDTKQLAVLQDRVADAVEHLARTDLDAEQRRKGELTLARAKLDVSKKQNEISEKQAKWEAESAKAAEEFRRKKAEAAALMQRNFRSLTDAQRGRTDWTLQDIANLEGQQLSRGARWKIGAAQRVLDMREQARFLRLEGDETGVNRLLGESDKLASSITGLSAAEMNPLGELVKSFGETKENMKALADMAAKQGIRVIPPDE